MNDPPDRSDTPAANTIPAPPATGIPSAPPVFDDAAMQMLAVRLEESILRSTERIVAHAVGQSERRYLQALSGINLKLQELRTKIHNDGANNALLGSTLTQFADRVQRIVNELDDGANGLTGISVLLVEDEDKVRESTASIILRRKGRCWPTDSHLEAARAIQSMQFHAAIIDLRLGSRGDKLSGLELAEELRVTHPDIGIIISTGSMNGHDVEERINRLHAMVMMKPHAVGDLVRAIREVARQSG